MGEDSPNLVTLVVFNLFAFVNKVKYIWSKPPHGIHSPKTKFAISFYICLRFSQKKL
jgi:hypothetical protein